ncbi:MAG: phosphatidylinositol mannoside acyltransferase [Bifidobacteriaceae bacterium]|jgi:KDO2-lipid IV(A) lauroyltransferase|nr:phosphatidylinositol mannoside acyltransferase [Bifidobacteriaceae bacterium]
MNLTSLAWKVVPRLPAGLARAAFGAGADLAALKRGGGVRQLEANLARVRPELTRPQLRRLGREGMRRYMRYFCEAFQIASWSEEKVDSMVRLANEGRVRQELESQSQVVLAMGHMGNWDLAGAWATRHLGPITTVAEHLEPEEVFQDFLAMRREIGLEIIPLEKGQPVFRQLLRTAQTKDPWVIPLLADRDLGRGGVKVSFFGENALVAPGPAALALAVDRPLYALAMYREGPRYVLDFSERISPPAGETKVRQIEAMTQAWVDYLETAIKRHPADWHMLQKVFVPDLDPERLKRARGQGE